MNATSIWPIVQAIAAVVLAIVAVIQLVMKWKRKGEFWYMILLFFCGFTFLFFGSLISLKINLEISLATKAHQKELLTRIDQLNESQAVLIERCGARRPKSAPGAPAQKANEQLRITHPLDGATIVYRPRVQGTVADPEAKVWIIVHPMEVGSYWVQPSMGVGSDGTWKAMPYIGRAGSLDTGKHFQIMAIADPREELIEGLVFDKCPEARWRSEVIEVVRK